LQKQKFCALSYGDQFWQSLIEAKDNPPLEEGYHLFRHESGKLVSVLTKIFGPHNLELAEDVVQDTLLKALAQWKIKGIPDNPSAWLFTVARNKALDIIRRNKRQQQFSADISHLLQSEYTLVPVLNEMVSNKAIEDDQLRMMFTCCHPSLPAESQAAMILKTLCGFSVAEIAKAFVTNKATIEKRLYRARQQFREEKIGFEIPAAHELKSRLNNVLLSIYLLFNEGYSSTQHEKLVREDLLGEALRLAGLLADHPMTGSPEVWALLALMCFTNARNPSRLDQEGNILLLQEQDRNQWNAGLIRRGIVFLDRSAEGEAFSTYHLQAAIAFEHCSAMSYASTNWQNILQYYNLLYQLQPTPVVALNRAIVISELQGAAAGIRAIESIPDIESLQHYYLLPATLGELHAQLNEKEKARLHLEKALELTQSNAEKNLLMEKLKNMH
jgi:RNA polymerase sigma-70 factor (ECF subfamily)